MKLKCLPLQNWMNVRTMRNQVVGESSGYYKEHPPIIHRDGYYCHGNSCWFEVDSTAWMCETNAAFLYELALHHASELRPEQIEGLRAICKTNLATANQKELWDNYETHKTVAKINKNAIIGIRRLKKLMRG